MSVVVKHLNADSTFLLVFSHEETSHATDLPSVNGRLSVLIDPWLAGPSIVTAPWFAKTEHRITSAIQHLSEIEEPDVVIVSQNKPDHCHKETLLQLRPHGKTIIAAEPSAAKTIKSWNYFDPTNVRGILKYDPRSKFGRSLQIRIPPLSPLGLPGELNIAFIPAKSYMTGLHNAFGITYQPPTHTRAFAPVSTVDLPRTTRYFHVPLTPTTMPPSSPPPLMSPTVARPMSFDGSSRNHDLALSPRLSQIRRHRPRLSRDWNRTSDLSPNGSDEPSIQVVPNPETGEIVDRFVTIPSQSPRLDSRSQFKLGHAPSASGHALPTPPDSPATMPAVSSECCSAGTRLSPLSPASGQTDPTSPALQNSVTALVSMSGLSPVTPARPKAISIIYSPHGLPLTDLQPYIQNHLVRVPGALPLTLLFHSFDHAQNPWYLGGNIMTGVQGGAELARSLMARCWISAHDEVKDDHGLSVKKLRVKRVTADEATEYLWEGEYGKWLQGRGWTCNVRSLDVGKEMVIRSVSPNSPKQSSVEGPRESS
ncbi:hypothetical protein A1O1_04301 [Capronia coronata CBS 617.96]|uniref:Uncharacterized protein n=1 Tax=Capronia coronata CBS 617.96 TaxID=1182541 RepID=W9YE85_9EURO|nr:uncharacterized protein A1O1_04301 [Capronia coronata CBS 617.96]EXJ91192.1 hypothetical protein A1O1_04301 [Capronia coronata CBS 617.96]